MREQASGAAARIREQPGRVAGEVAFVVGMNVAYTEARVHAANEHVDEARQELAIQHAQLEHPDQPDHTVIIEAEPVDEGPEPLDSNEWTAVAEGAQNLLELKSGVEDEDDG